MLDELVDEARRQLQICNACRYCEGYCSVFPALHENHLLDDADITQLANLCHNCRGCYYACQYTEPHEFALNIPAVLAELRQESWKLHAWPTGFATLFERAGMVVMAGLLAAFTLLFAISWALPSEGTGFYAHLSHGVMVAIFTPAFLLPLLAIAVSVHRYWRAVGGGAIRFKAIQKTLTNIANMRNLAGGHGEGCNFEDQDRYSNARRWAHHLTMYGFLLCFSATCAGTILHYGFDIKAPYSLFSLPKLLGISGGVMLCVGTIWLLHLKLRADPKLGDLRHWNGEMTFILLLFLVSATGLALYAATGSALVAPLLILHLSAVLTFFILMPYSKMAHGFYRLAALLKDAS